MSQDWNRDDGVLGLGARLHVRRAKPSEQLVGSILDRIAVSRHAR